MRTVVYYQARSYIRAFGDVNTLLRAGEKEFAVSCEAISRVDVVHLPANLPTEDFYSGAKCLSSNAYLFGVFDGHGGTSCSHHVAMQLYDYVGASVIEKHVVKDLPLQHRIKWLFSNIKNFDGYKRNCYLWNVMVKDYVLIKYCRDEHWRNVHNFYESSCRNKTFTTVEKSLEEAFEALDNDFMREALQDSNGKLNKRRINIVRSGSCAIVAHLRKQHMHIANVGDSAAVLGVFNHGHISARLLSKAHCIENGDEIKRLRTSHPAEERGKVLKAGRLFGELYPLRAFGDARYKWSKNVQEEVFKPFGDIPPNGIHTPPYLSAQPEVLYHRLTLNDRFLVLASDGLWDWLDPDTVVRLVFDHELGLQTLIPYQSGEGVPLSQVEEGLKHRAVGDNGKPLDANSATHLLRHALSGCSGGPDYRYKRLAQLLHIPPGMARNYRDDITIIVIHLNPDYFKSSEPE
uniref:PPM-type phosphatase domain-containing protein n=1 Tax=Syphacia muris TaxID=451379 RepID=A0A0N5AGR5_9BILA